MATKENSWRLNRQVNVSVLIQLLFLASLIVGSWVNLQRQLDLLQHDVSMLLESNRKFQEKLEKLSVNNVAMDYRLKAVEKSIEQKPIARGN